MKRTNIKRFVLSLLIITMITIVNIGSGSSKLYASENKNIILVLDTSLSMIGFGGENILSDVKKSIESYIDKLEDGDKITFISFDTDVKVFPSVLIDDKNDRDIIKKYIFMTEAKGKWTYTIKMIKTVFETAEKLTKEDEKRKTVIVVMTDGLDDPPPGRVKNKFNMKDLANEYQGSGWWIYFISFSDLKKNEKLIAEMKKELEKVSKHTQIIDASKDPVGGMKEFEKTQVPDESFPIWIVIAIIVIISGLAVLIYIKRGPGIIVSGTLEYWNTDILDPYIGNFDLTRLQSNEIVIGKKVGSHLYLREIEAVGLLTIKGVKDKEKTIRYAINAGEGDLFVFKNKEQSEYLEDGDVFQFANYGFKYISS